MQEQQQRQSRQQQRWCAVAVGELIRNHTHEPGAIVMTPPEPGGWHEQQPRRETERACPSVAIGRWVAGNRQGGVVLRLCEPEHQQILLGVVHRQVPFREGPGPIIVRRHFDPRDQQYPLVSRLHRGDLGQVLPYPMLKNGRQGHRSPEDSA